MRSMTVKKKLLKKSQGVTSIISDCCLLIKQYYLSYNPQYKEQNKMFSVSKEAQW